jgi:hypothetical protein
LHFLSPFCEMDAVVVRKPETRSGSPGISDSSSLVIGQRGGQPATASITRESGTD